MIPSTNYSEDADTESGKEADKTDDSEATDTTYVIFVKLILYHLQKN